MTISWIFSSPLQTAVKKKAEANKRQSGLDEFISGNTLRMIGIFQKKGALNRSAAEMADLFSSGMSSISIARTSAKYLQLTRRLQTRLEIAVPFHIKMGSADCDKSDWGNAGNRYHCCAVLLSLVWLRRRSAHLW